MLEWQEIPIPRVLTTDSSRPKQP